MACIPKYLVDAFTAKLKAGEVDPAKLSEMTSDARRAFFSEFMGESNAKFVNAQFESKLLLKNQQQGMINWAKKLSGMKPEAQRDLISRVERMTEILKPKDMDSFLSDLAEKRLGIGVTAEEAGKIADLAKTVSERKSKITEQMPNGSPERLAYGEALFAFKEYVGALKLESEKLTFKEWITSPSEILQTITGTAKSILSSFDNSFFGRQGMVTLVTRPDVWGNNFVKSWGDIGKELSGVDAMMPIKADIYSRQNAVNKKYAAMGLDIGLTSEEAFPSTLPEKIPLLRRLYLASQSAYNGAALRIRADLADALISEAEGLGIDVTDKTEGVGKLVNSMTGRGAIQLSESQAKFINVAIFSIKFVKAQFDVLTAHMLDKNVGKFAKRKAAENLLKVIGVIAAILGAAKVLDPDSVELDPRSSKFGKIMVGKKRNVHINVTGGLNGVVVLASKLIPTMHRGKWGWWKKTNKGYINLGENKYGIGDPLDEVVSFMRGKASPFARVILNIFKGETFKGEKLTVGGQLLESGVPIPIQNAFELAQTAEGADVILWSLLDMLGVSVNVSDRKKKTVIR